MALLFVKRLQHRGGFRRLLLKRQICRESLEYQAIARIQGTEGEAQEPQEPHDRWERLLRRATHGAGEGPE